MTLTERQLPAGSLSIEVSADGDAKVISLCGELDLSNAKQLEQLLRKALTFETGPVVLDMKELTFIDSTGIALLVAALRQDRDSRRLRFVPSASPGVVRVLRLTGVAAKLPALH